MNWIQRLGLLLVLLCVVSSQAQAAPAPSPDSSHNAPRLDQATSLPVGTHAYRPSPAELRHWLQINPEDAELRVALGLELEAIGDLAGAVSQYHEALRFHPEHALAFYHLSRARIAERERSESQTAHSTSLAERESLAQSHLARGSVVLAEGGHASAAMAFRHALQINPSNPQAHLGLGRARYMMGNVEGAITAYRAALTLNPDLAQARLRLAIALMVREDWASALTQLAEATRLAPALTEAHFHLGVVRYTLGDYAGAIAAYRQALALTPDFAEAHYHLGLGLKLMNREEEAAREFLIAAEAGLPEAQYFLGSAYLNGFGVARDRLTAIEWWFRAEEQGLDRARQALAELRRDALLERNQSAHGSQDLWNAFKEYRHGMWQGFPELSPEDPADELGARLLRVGRPHEAVPVLIREAAALSDRAPVLLEALYVEGIDGHAAPFDTRILEYFEKAAGEGLPQPRLALARIYGLGLGVEPDSKKATALLRNHPDPAASYLLRAFNAELEDTHVSTMLRMHSGER